MGLRVGAVDYEFLVENTTVEAMLFRLDTALNPVAIASFLGATVDPWLRGRAKARFTSEGDDVVGGWLPLAAATNEIRKNLGYAPEHPINVRSGALERYIVDSTHDIQVEPASSATLTMPGSSPDAKTAAKVYGAQYGTNRAPARPVLGMNDKDTAFVLTELSGFFAKTMGMP